MIIIFSYKDEFGVFRFSSPRLARNHQTLIDIFNLKTFVGGLGNGEHMWG